MPLKDAVRIANDWYITKTSQCNEDPLTPHLYIIKLGFTGVYIIFLILLQNIDCGYSLELPHWGGSNVYPRSMFWAKIRKNITIFYLKIIIFTAVKYFCILYGHVIVMIYTVCLAVSKVKILFLVLRAGFGFWLLQFLVFAYFLYYHE